MKKLALCALVLFLIVLSGAHAGMTVSNPRANSTFNYGDQIVITGTIELGENIPGSEVQFLAVSDSTSQEIPITTKIYSFLADTPVSFSLITKGTLLWDVTSTINTADDWRIKVKIKTGYDSYADFYSGKFTITENLFVERSINARIFNRGETLEFSSIVLNAHGFPVEGKASISLEESGLGGIVTDSADLKNGYISYAYTFKASDPPGTYSLEANFLDNYGNARTSIIDDIIVTDELKMACSLQKTNINPGGVVVLFGTIDNVHDEPLDKISTKSWFTTSEDISTTYDAISDSNGHFSFEAPISKQDPPGQYTAKAEATDEYGNKGKCAKTFTVAEEKKLLAGLKLNASSAYIGDQVDLVAALENTGNIDIQGTVNFYMDSYKIGFNSFTLLRGEKKDVLSVWDIPEAPGDHLLKVTILVDEQRLAESESAAFVIEEKPVRLLDSLGGKLLLAVVILLIIAAVFFFNSKRKSFRDKLWRHEFKKSFSKRKH
ncbi:MAG: hypothetical protein ABIG20_05050 [archaeon]